MVSFPPSPLPPCPISTRTPAGAFLPTTDSLLSLLSCPSFLSPDVSSYPLSSFMIYTYIWLHRFLYMPFKVFLDSAYAKTAFSICLSESCLFHLTWWFPALSIFQWLSQLHFSLQLCRTLCVCAHIVFTHLAQCTFNGDCCWPSPGCSHHQVYTSYPSPILTSDIQSIEYFLVPGNMQYNSKINSH